MQKSQDFGGSFVSRISPSICFDPKNCSSQRLRIRIDRSSSFSSPSTEGVQRLSGASLAGDVEFILSNVLQEDFVFAEVQKNAGMEDLVFQSSGR